MCTVWHAEIWNNLPPPDLLTLSWCFRLQELKDEEKEAEILHSKSTEWGHKFITFTYNSTVLFRLLLTQTSSKVLHIHKSPQNKTTLQDLPGVLMLSTHIYVFIFMILYSTYLKLILFENTPLLMETLKPGNLNYTCKLLIHCHSVQ